MKFQNPSFKFFLNGRTNGRTDKPKAICSPLFKVGGIITIKIIVYSTKLFEYLLTTKEVQKGS